MALAPRGPRPVLLLPLVLLTTGLAELSEGASYQQFVNQHVDFPRSRVPNNQNYCDLLMQRRGLTHPACKLINTFIHAPADVEGDTSRGTSMTAKELSMSPRAGRHLAPARGAVDTGPQFVSPGSAWPVTLICPCT
ncbi:Ribonuclease [Platysternon megacephalum]|uniref:Ribonuclease n=1 Tax=Platysternon megacephalum TaxID=55544 RepID=A0A4D9DKR2_9SAUR|nr:Ribonuclease [Platysternon megacephalum]